MATQDDARKRYPSADLLAADVARYLALRPLRARPGTLLCRTGKLMRRNAGRTAMALGALCSLDGAAQLATHGWRSSALAPVLAAAPSLRANEARRAAIQIGEALGVIDRLARQGDGEAQLALPLLYWAQGHLLLSGGQPSDAMRSFHQGTLARRAAPPLPWLAGAEAPKPSPPAAKHVPRR